MWNLVYLQLLLEEHGFQVRNLGFCVPESTLVYECTAVLPDLIVLSSVNGHGFYDGRSAVRALRAVPALRRTTIVIGGKLGIGDADQNGASGLLAAGFDSVFSSVPGQMTKFRAFLDRVGTGVAG
jgi:methylaspartate mutase sigma subunit